MTGITRNKSLYELSEQSQIAGTNNSVNDFLGVVDTSRNQEINGDKTFNGSVNFTGDIYVGGSDVVGTGNLVLSNNSTGGSSTMVGGNNPAVEAQVVAFGTTAGFNPSGISLFVSASGAASEALRCDNTTTSGLTRLMIWDVDNGTLERVSVGDADSGGTGYKVLRIPN